MEFLLWIGGGASALLAVGAVVRGVWRAMNRIVRIHDAVQQLLPNGGSSLFDKVNRIESNVAQLTSRLDAHIDDGK